jgi:hypothetical protein
MPAPAFPGVALHTIRPPSDVIRSVQRRLTACGCGPLDETGRLDAATKAAIKRFQARFPDASGEPLVVDGDVGPITWAALFGDTPPPVATSAASLATDALEFALAEIGTMEQPPGSNRGPRVDEYLRAVGLNPSGRFACCAAFVYWCFAQAAKRAGGRNPVIKTAGVLAHWRDAGRAEIPRITRAEAVSDPSLIQPGLVFIMDFGGGVGHTGFVVEAAGGRLITVEGNTNDGGSREGVGVFRRDGRKIASITPGFIDYRSF